jgi:hypothetical protein
LRGWLHAAPITRRVVRGRLIRHPRDPGAPIHAHAY